MLLSLTRYVLDFACTIRLHPIYKRVGVLKRRRPCFYPVSAARYRGRVGDDSHCNNITPVHRLILLSGQALCVGERWFSRESTESSMCRYARVSRKINRPRVRTRSSLALLPAFAVVISVKFISKAAFPSRRSRFSTMSVRWMKSSNHPTIRINRGTRGEPKSVFANLVNSRPVSEKRALFKFTRRLISLQYKYAENTPALGMNINAAITFHATSV